MLVIIGAMCSSFYQVCLIMYVIVSGLAFFRVVTLDWQDVNLIAHWRLITR